jgi:hypothetical protein
LILEAFEGNAEVDDSHFDINFRQIVRVTELRRDEKLKFGVVICLLITHPDKQTIVFFVDLLLENGVDGRL